MVTCIKSQRVIFPDGIRPGCLYVSGGKLLQVDGEAPYDRLLDFGCEVKLEAKREAPVCKDPVAWVKYDLQVSKEGLAWLHELVEAAREDYTTFDFLKEYYQDEEEDLYWAEQQLDLIECIGVQNWLIQQL